MNKTKLKEKLSDMAYQVTQMGATEPPFTGKFLSKKYAGMFVCVVCGHALFSSDTKFDSGSGWPSFWNVVHHGNVKLNKDSTLGLVRTEVRCANCNAHLGHLFEDGPSEKGGLRYCINSCALDLKKN